MPNYYDKVLEDFESEGIFDTESSDESSDEAIWNQNRRGPTSKFPGSLTRPTRFERGVSSNSSQGQGNLVNKSEFKSSLSSISDQVSDLKKANLTLGSSLGKLEKTTESVAKGLAKEGKAQASVMNSSTMMTMMGALINKPTLNFAALKITKGTPASPGSAGTPPDGTNPGTPPTPATAGTPDIIEQVANQEAIQVDLTKTLLFAMMPMMMSGSSSGGGDSYMMPLMMVLLLSKPGTGLSSGSSTGGTDNSLVLIMMMMMMMNKK